jgi:hypothetical protein
MTHKFGRHQKKQLISEKHEFVVNLSAKLVLSVCFFQCNNPMPSWYDSWLFLQIYHFVIALLEFHDPVIVNFFPVFQMSSFLSCFCMLHMLLPLVEISWLPYFT